MLQGRIPPNREIFAKYGVNVTEQEEVIWQPLYDFILYPAAGSLNLPFFIQPVGQGVTSHPGGAGTKTEADTNMTLAGVLPSPVKEFVIAVSVEFYSGLLPGRGDVAPATAGQMWNDVHTIARSGRLLFRIGAKTWVEDAPLGVFPSVTRLGGAAALSDTTTAAADNLSQIDYAAMCGVPYNITPFLIPSNQDFRVSLLWPNVQALPSANAASRIGIRLHGFQIRLAQ